MDNLANAILADNPIAYWKMIDLSDSANGGYSLTKIGSPTFNNQPINSNLYPTYLALCDGFTDVSCRIRHDLLPSFSAVEGWFKFVGAQTEYPCVIGLRMPLSGSANRAMLIFYPGVGFCFFVDVNGAASVYTSAKTYNELTNSPHHFLIQYDSSSGKTKVFIDGVEDAELSVPINILAPLSNTWVVLGGYYYNGTTRGNCIIGDVAIYANKMSPEKLAARQNYKIGPANTCILRGQSPVWANKETQTQAWPGENSCKQTSQTAKKVYGVTAVSMLTTPPLRKDLGFIEGVITRKTAPAVGQHVICLDERFNLVAETLSGAGGHYRFDSLPINGLYAIHAYDNNEYKYAPVGADRRTPEAYS